MKEQTPITAEQYLNNKGFNTDGQHFEVLLDVMEQYAQAKVLEALERYEKKIRMYWAEQYAETPPSELLLRNRSKTKV